MFIVNERDRAYRNTERDSGTKYLTKGPRVNFALMRFNPGEEFDAHYHEIMGENFYIIEGGATFVVEGKAYELSVGDMLSVEPGEIHYIMNRGDIPVKMVTVLAPSRDPDKILVDNYPSQLAMKGVGIMPKKVLIITGSPRKSGNSNTLASFFAAGAVAAGNEVEIFDAAGCNMDGCHGDNSCHESGSCALEDDGASMYEMMNRADVLLLATPVYFKSFSSQIKRVIDRFNPYCAPKGRAKCHITDTYLIATGLMPDENVFNGIREEFAHINAVLGFHPAGELLVPAVQATDDIQSQEVYLTRAATMGFQV